MAIKNRMAGAGTAGPAKPQTPKMPQINVDFTKLWATIKEYIPDILMDPLRLLSNIFSYVNVCLT